MAMNTPAGWYADPMGRYEHRYWDGVRWTDNVSRGGNLGTDPVEGPAPMVSDPGPRDPAASAPTGSDPATAGAGVAQVALPVKVCPSCRSQSQTTDPTCPYCGKRFVRAKKWPWVVGVIFLFMVAGIGGCALLVGTAVDRVATELNAVQARHAITRAQFDRVALGSSRAEVLAELGRPPVNIQDFLREGILDGEDLSSSCIYFNRAGGSFGDRFQFCFENDVLRSKNSY